MIRIYKIILLAFFIPVNNGFYVEVAFLNNDPLVSYKIICNRSTEILRLGKKDKVLWHGAQFGKYDRQQISNFGLDVDMSINASKNYICFLVSPESVLDKLEEKKLGIPKTRIAREGVTASIPMENGICPPGHRIDGDRCFPCFPGSFTSGQQYECFLCPKDFYMDKQAADSCWPCPEGSHTIGQGAASKESCVPLDGSGHAILEQGSPWTILLIVVGVVILLLWVIIIYWLVRRWRKSHKDDEGKERLSHVYHRISDTDKEEPIYVEIGDNENGYEEPRTPSSSHDYLDLESPSLPERRKDHRTGSVYNSLLQEDQYEIPISKSEQTKNRSENHCEVPIERRSYSQYKDSSEKSSSTAFEIPILPDPNDEDSEEHVYSEINSEDGTNPGKEGNENKIHSFRSVPCVPERYSTKNIPTQFSDSSVNATR